MNPYLILALVVAWGLSLLGVGNWQHDAGVTSERLVWQTKQSTQLQTALADVSRLQKQARADEAQHGKNLAGISAKYQEELTHEKTTNARTVAAIRAGTLKLRQHVPAKPGPAGGITAPGTCPSGCNGPEACEFSVETAEFLYELTGDADQVAEQLSACQQVIKADRELGDKERESD